MPRSISLRDLSIANLTVGGGDPVALIEAAGASGFGAAGLVLRTAMAKPVSHEIIGKPEVIRAIKAASAATGVKIFDVEAFVLRPGVDAESFRPALATGAELGATHISCIGVETAGPEQPLSEAERTDLFGALCDEAAVAGLHVGVEFMRYRDIPTMAKALALIEAAGRANAGVILDLLHFHRTGGTLAEAAACPASRIAYVQLCDAGAAEPPAGAFATEARGGRLHLGHGVIPIEAMLDLAPPGAQLVIETPVAAEAGLSLQEKVANAAKYTGAFLAARNARLAAQA